MATRGNMSLFPTLNEKMLLDFLVKSSDGDSYTYGNYFIKINNEGGEIFKIYCYFEENGEYNSWVRISINKKLSKIVDAIIDDTDICMIVLEQFFPKDGRIPFDEEDVKECE